MAGAHLKHLRLGMAAVARAASPVVLVAVTLLVLDDNGPPRRGPRQEHGRPAGARVQQREQQHEAADGAEHDAGDEAGRGRRVLPVVGRRYGLEAAAALRRARGDDDTRGGYQVDDGRCSGGGAFGW